MRQRAGAPLLLLLALLVPDCGEEEKPDRGGPPGPSPSTSKAVHKSSVVPVPEVTPPTPPQPPGTPKEFTIELPAEKRPFPEPLPEGKEPGFRLRGIKGWAWTPEQYLAEIPILAKCKMNFLMNCYLSLFDVLPGNGNPPGGNRWWVPLQGAKREGFEEIVRACKRYGIQFCFAMHPMYKSPRPLKYDSEKDLNDLWDQYAWMQGLGVRWFSICLDDINESVEARGQSKVVNEILRRLRAKDPQAQMIFCPTQYFGDGSRNPEYLKTLAEELHPDVYVFWTGEHIWAPVITRACAERFRDTVKRRLVVWDNYPANDAEPVLHLGPITGRDPDLCQAAEGYMSNSHCTQSEINRIPMLTCADYAYNPAAYDPKRSVGQALLQLAETPGQRQVLKDLVELYPGRYLLPSGRRHCRSLVINRFVAALDEPDGQDEAQAILRRVQDVAARLKTEFPGRYQATSKTIELHLSLMQEYLDRQTGRVPKDRPIPGWPIW